jgi:hypothetical protein
MVRRDKPGTARDEDIFRLVRLVSLLGFRGHFPRGVAQPFCFSRRWGRAVNIYIFGDCREGVAQRVDGIVFEFHPRFNKMMSKTRITAITVTSMLLQVVVCD